MDLSVMIPRKYYQMGNLHFEYIREDKYMYLHETKGENTHFLYKTPMLKVFKNIHIANNFYFIRQLEIFSSKKKMTYFQLLTVLLI